MASANQLHTQLYVQLLQVTIALQTTVTLLNCCCCLREKKLASLSNNKMIRNCELLHIAVKIIQ